MELKTSVVVYHSNKVECILLGSLAVVQNRVVDLQPFQCTANQ